MVDPLVDIWMQHVFSFMFKVLRKIFRSAMHQIEMGLCHIKFYIHNIQHKDFSTNGLPYISIAKGGKCIIGRGFRMNNGLRGNLTQ